MRVSAGGYCGALLGEGAEPASPGGVGEAGAVVFGIEGVGVGAGAIGGGAAVAGAGGAKVEDGGVTDGAGAGAAGGTVALAFTPAPTAAPEVTRRSGAAATVVERVTRRCAVMLAAGVVVAWCVTVVRVVADCVASALGGGVLAASAAAFGEMAVAGAPLGAPGVICAMPPCGRVAYQPAAASTISAITPTAIAVGAIDPLRRTVAGARVTVVSSAIGVSPFGLMAASRSISADVAAPAVGAMLVAAAFERERLVRRLRLDFSQIGVGANIEPSDSVFMSSPPLPRV